MLSACLGFVSAERAERVLGFVEKQNKSRKEYYVLKLKASQQKYPFVVDFKGFIAPLGLVIVELEVH